MSKAITYLITSAVLAHSVWGAQAPFPSADPYATLVYPKKVLTPGLKSRVQGLLDANEVPGYSLGILRLDADDQEEYMSWGKQNESDGRVEEESLFYIGSCSKAFTTASLAILIDDFAHGRNNTPLPSAVREFNWRTKIQDLLPKEWELMDKWASNAASLKDILSHVSGLPGHELAYGPDESPSDTILHLRHLRPTYELREQYQYNNLMYITAAHIIATYSGVPFATFVEERIFRLLNMTQSTYDARRADASGKLAQVFSGIDGRRIPWWFDRSGASVIDGAGGIISSAPDLVKWTRFLLGGGNSAVSETILDTMKPQSLMDPNTDGGRGIMTYGFGWGQVIFKNGRRLVTHTGGLPGASSTVSLFPDQRVAIVQLANADEKHLVEYQIRSEIEQVIFGYSSTQESDDIFRTTAPKNWGYHDTALQQLHSGRADIGATDLSSFAGEYSNPGYGNFTLCSRLSRESSCQRVVADFDTVEKMLEQSADGRVDSLFAALPRIWSSHLHFSRHSNSTVFDLRAPYLFPHGYGKNSTPFAYQPIMPPVRAEFVVGENGGVHGFGLFGLQGKITERERWGKTVEEKAEVWFQKV